MKGLKGGFTGQGGGGAGVAYIEVGDNIQGWNDVISRLRGFRLSTQNKILERAVKPALQMIVQAAQENVLSLSTTGRYHRGLRSAIASKTSVKITKASKSRGWFTGRAAVWYGEPRRSLTGKGNLLPAGLASTAHLIEYGYNLTHYFGRKIAPRRIQARPFMRPAYNQERGPAEERFKEVFADAIADATRGSK